MLSDATDFKSINNFPFVSIPSTALCKWCELLTCVCILFIYFAPEIFLWKKKKLLKKKREKHYGIILSSWFVVLHLVLIYKRTFDACWEIYEFSGSFLHHMIPYEHYIKCFKKNDNQWKFHKWHNSIFLKSFDPLFSTSVHILRFKRKQKLSDKYLSYLYNVCRLFISTPFFFFVYLLFCPV